MARMRLVPAIAFGLVPTCTKAGGLFGKALLAVLLLTAWAGGSVTPAQAQACSPSADGALANLPEAMREFLQGGGPNRPAICTPPPPRLSGGGRPPQLPRPAVQPPLDGPFLQDEVVASVLGGAAQAQAIANDLGLNVINTRSSVLLGSSIVRFGIPDGRSVSEVLQQLTANNQVEDFDAHHLFDLQQAAGLPPRFELQKIALDHTIGRLSGRGVRIAVIDTAIDEDHPVFEGAVRATFDAMPDVPISDRSHSTAVAGLIAGRGNLKGVAPDAELLIARAFDTAADGTARSSAHAIIASLDWATEQGARIINMSFAGPRNRLIARALTAAEARGILLVAAAGNNGPSAPFAYPAAEQEVMAITATDARDRPYTGANRGQYIALSAPGVDVLAPAPQGQSTLVTGTSFAAAILSGIAALVIEQRPQLTPFEIGLLLQKSARDLGSPGRDAIFGYGLATAELPLP